MGCSRCNRNRRIKATSGFHIDNILNELDGGLCKITLKRVNENNPREIYCTRQDGVVPSEGSPDYRSKDKVPSIIKSGLMLVWALDKSLNENEKSESGWLKIKTDQIISYDFIGKIPRGVGFK